MNHYNPTLDIAYFILGAAALFAWVGVAVWLSEKIWGDKTYRTPLYGLFVTFSPAIIWAVYVVVTHG